MKRVRPQSSPLSFCTLLLALLACGLATRARAGEPLGLERQGQVLRDALDRFDAAVGHLRGSPEQAQQELRQAAAGFDALIGAGLHNAALEYNLGNTYFRLGDLGRAILHYRRGQQLNPGDAALSANLEYARERVEPAIVPRGGEQLVTRLLFWHYTTSLRIRYLWALVGSVLGWGLLAAWLRWRSGPLLTCAGLALLAGIANGASVGWQLHEDSARPPAVLVRGPQVLRSGRGDGYEPAVKQPLGAGVECRILAERADWAEVELRDGHSGWLPLSALERVTQAQIQGSG